MKFLCDNCKAKYQIADEKVAGKTVRMKCRKCGHQIEVRAAVTETSVSAAAPRAPTAAGGLGSGAGLRPPQRPGGGLATSLSATKPRPSTPSAPPGALAGAFQKNIQDPHAPPNVAGGQARSGQIELSVTDEWYVAINGVPVGPVRISELRRKAAVGAVTEDSLCWQEGLEEWRPIKSIPDLAALVREAGQGNRPSLVSSPDGGSMRPSTAGQRAVGRASTPPPPRATAPSHPAGPAGPPPPTAPSPATAPLAPPQRSNVVPLRPAASSNEDFGMGPSGGAAAAYAQAPNASMTPAPAPIAPMFTPQPVPLQLPPPSIDPFAMPPAAPAMSQTGPYRDSVHPSHPSQTGTDVRQPSFLPPPSYDGQQRKAGVPLWFWPILLVALGFGGGVAFLVFRPQAAPVVIQMPPTAAPTQTAAPAATPTDVPPPTASNDPAPEASSPKTGGKVASRGSKNTGGAAPTTEEKKGLDLGNLVGGAGGPNVGPGGPGAAAGGGLDQAGVERVVAAHRAGVKRTCWERGGADQKSSVNVTVTANVAPNGTVASTSSSGDDLVVSKCIETQVKSWMFSAPGSTTTINIPFKFVRQ